MKAFFGSNTYTFEGIFLKNVKKNQNVTAINVWMSQWSHLCTSCSYPLTPLQRMCGFNFNQMN